MRKFILSLYLRFSDMSMKRSRSLPTGAYGLRYFYITKKKNAQKLSLHTELFCAEDILVLDLRTELFDYLLPVVLHKLKNIMAFYLHYEPFLSHWVELKRFSDGQATFTLNIIISEYSN